MLKGLINTEFKFNDVLTELTVTNAGSFTLLNGIESGLQDDDRVGASIRIKSYEYRQDVIISSSENESFLRTIIFIDLKTDGVAPLVSDLLQNSSAVISSPRNLDNRHRFLILKDDVTELSTNRPNKYNQWYKKVNIKTQYDLSTGVAAAIAAHPMYMLQLSNQPTNGPFSTTYNRIRYVDN